MPSVKKSSTKSPKPKISSVSAGIDLQAALQEHFGFDNFKGNQKAIIENLMAGNDSFVIKPTGGGKSLCYQLPGILLPGCAIIVSPLIALMKNQVDLVRGYSDKDNVAHFLNSYPFP
jgi:ATP-dependent DNA helicase RecQ